MLKRIKKLRKLWKLTENDGEDFIDALPIPGNGKAEFLSDGNQEDLEQFIQEQRGWRGFLKKHGIE